MDITIQNEMIMALQKIAKNTDPGSHHVPAVFPRPDGSFGVLCYACSQEAGHAVETCLLPIEDRHYQQGWPPAELFPNVNDKAVHDLEKIRRIVAGVLMDSPAGDPRQYVAQAVLDVLNAE